MLKKLITYIFIISFIFSPSCSEVENKTPEKESPPTVTEDPGDTEPAPLPWLDSLIISPEYSLRNSTAEHLYIRSSLNPMLLNWIWKLNLPPEALPLLTAVNFQLTIFILLCQSATQQAIYTSLSTTWMERKTYIQYK